MKLFRQIVRVPINLLSWKWWVSKLNWIVSLVWTKEIGYLLVLMVIVLFCEVMTVGHYWGKIVSLDCWRRVDWGSLGSFFSAAVWRPAFVNLFSAEKASANWSTMILFFVTWLVGGGALVSVMVGQYNKNAAGGFRRCRFLVGKHIVVLGWDDGLLVELTREISAQRGNGRLVKWICKVFFKQRDCYVVTRQNAGELKKLLASAGIENSYIYQGDYDDPKEWRKNLRIEKAAKVFIAGERDESAHDARVRVLFEQVNAICKAPIKVNIHDFGLAQKLAFNDSAGVYESFYSRWAKALWEKMLVSRCCNGGYSLFVVGFGAMGKAVVLEATKLDHMPSSIVVTDDNSESPEKLKTEKARFLAQFPQMKELVSFEDAWDKGLQAIAASNGKNAVIVVAKKRSEKGMFCMMDIVSAMKDSVTANTQLVLDQEIDGYGSKNNEEKLEVLSVRSVPIQLFGMRKGC